MSDRAEILISAIDKATDVLDKIERNLGSVGSAADKLKYALSALGGAISVHAFTSMIEGAIEAENALHELNLRTGLSIELLSALRPIAAESGMGMDQVATAVQKLEKNMLSFIQTGTGPAAKGFEAIGISQKQAQAGLEDMNAFLPEFARRLVDSGNGAQVAALAQELLGKAGANAIPLLVALAEAHQLVGTKTDEQVAKAHQFVVAMAQMSERTQLLKESMADGLLPALLRVTETFTEMRGKGTDAQGFFETMGEALKYAAGGAGSLWLALKDMGDGIGALAAQTAALLHGNLDAFKAIGAERDAQAAKNQAAYDRLWKNMFTPDSPTAAGKPKGSGSGDFSIGGKEGSGELSDYDKEWNKLIETMQQADKASAGIAANVLHMINDGALGKVTAEQKQQILNLAAEVESMQERNKYQKEFDEGVIKNATERNDLADKYNRLLEEQAQHWRDVIDPLAPFERQLEQINNLATEGKLTSEEWSAAVEHVTKKMDELGKVTEKTVETDKWARDLGLTFTSMFENAATKGKSLREVLSGIDQDIAKIILRESITKPAGAAITNAISGSGISDFFGSLFGGGSGLPEQLSGPGMQFAGGGSFDVGGSGGTDSQLVKFLATPGEKVNVQTPGQQSASEGDTHFFASFTINAVDSRSILQAIAPLQRQIVGWVNQAYNVRGARGPLG